MTEGLSQVQLEEFKHWLIEQDDYASPEYAGGLVSIPKVLDMLASLEASEE